MASIRSGIGENMKYKPKTVEIRLTKEEFAKLKAVRQLDRQGMFYSLQFGIR